MDSATQIAPSSATADSRQPPKTDGRPVSILIAALGGEGGGVLCEWLVDAATSAGFPVQGTSIPGVAQRTGATTYYVEISPLAQNELQGRHPIFSLTPVPGTVELVIASELLETARVLQAGFVDPIHTTLISSVSRTLTTLEKMAMGDGRLDSEELKATAREFSAEFISFDMQAEAKKAQTVVSAVLFGALAGSGKLPFSREFCEAAIRAQGKGVAQSLAGFARGFEACLAARAALAAGPAEALASGATSMRPALPARLSLALERFPNEALDVLTTALSRLIDYQDESYARLYLERIESVRVLSESLAASVSQRAELVREAGRFLALWMMFDDVIRVAELKTRATRFARVRDEVRAHPGDIVQIADYFKPRLEELLGILPVRLGRLVAAWAEGVQRIIGRPLELALALRTDSILGFIALRLVAACKPLRPRGARYEQEQVRIGDWLRALHDCSALGILPAQEIALCARLIKGYGATNARAHENLERIIATLASPAALAQWRDGAALARALASARQAALADPEGRALDRDIERHGARARPLAERPIKLIRRARA
jgi:indolepyruvate ferredoxin oxidoreductase beta subunit